MSDCCFKFDIEHHEDNCPDSKAALIVRTPLDHYEVNNLQEALNVVRQDFEQLVDRER